MGEEMTGPDADKQDPTANRGSKASREMKTRTAGKTKANERQARERHDIMRSKQIAVSPAAANRHPARASPDPAGGGLIEARKQRRADGRGAGRKKKNHPIRPPTRNDEAANAVSVMESEQRQASSGAKKNIAPFIYTIGGANCVKR